MNRILPRPTALTQPYWDGCRDGALRLQRCRDCERFQFYPRFICRHCQSRNLEWRDASGRGEVASYTVVRRAISPAYQAPYVVALVDLVEGVRMMAALVDVPPDELQVGMAVEVRFETWADTIMLPVFTVTKRDTGES